MNTVAQSMKLNAGDRVLSTDQEHEGGTDCWKYLADRRGTVLDAVAITEEMDDRAIVATIDAGIRKQTKVISVSHVLWTIGRKLPVAEIAAIARKKGLLCIVDGAQAVGGMPVDVKALGVMPTPPPDTSGSSGQRASASSISARMPPTRSSRSSG